MARWKTPPASWPNWWRGGQVLRHIGTLGVGGTAVGLTVDAGAGSLGVAGGNRMGGEEDVDRCVGLAAVGQFLTQRREALGHILHERFNESRVVEVLPHLVHLKFALKTGFDQGDAQVLAVLPAA